MLNIRGALKRVKLINVSIRTKLLLIYLLCVLIPTIVFTYAFFSSTLKSTKNEKLILYNQALNRISSTIEANAISAIELSNTIYPDEEMYQHINRRFSNQKESFDDYDSYLKNAWDKILPYNTNIVLFTVYTSNNTLLNGHHLHFIDDFVKKFDWYKKYTDINEKSAFLYHADELITGSARTKMVSYFRKMNYMRSSMYAHFIKITFRTDLFEKILKSEKIPGNLYLVDKENVIIAQSNPIIKAYGDTKFLNMNTLNTEAGQIVLKSTIQAMDDWQVVCILDKDYLMDAYRLNWMQMFILVLSITVFASIVIYMISSSFYKRIEMLVQYMGKVSKEEYVLIPEEKKGNDEIGLLITSMNSMITKIGSLIEDVYKAKIKETQLELLKKQSELNALQCQVNPHFMFNVLETIRIKSYLRNEFETARIVKYMSKIFRKLLLWNDDLIELQEEINFIKEYLEIQQYRYEDELNFEISVDESLLKLKIPKMTLQTFVDNSCEHGFSESQDLKKIKVSVREVDNHLVELRVYDNGKGIPQNMLKNINNIESKGIGIKNVIGRLNLYYDDYYSIKIDSEPDKFTEIVLTLDLNELRRSDYV